jgi:hypothetical protein
MKGTSAKRSSAANQASMSVTMGSPLGEGRAIPDCGHYCASRIRVFS